MKKEKLKNTILWRVFKYLFLVIIALPATFVVAQWTMPGFGTPFDLNGWTINTVDTGTVLLDDSVRKIDAHGICKNVQATDGKQYFVPTKSTSEWNSFINGAPSGINISECVTSSCDNGGVIVGGYCWYLGAYEQSCTDVCAGVGKTVDITGTKDYAGSGGTDANCQSVASGFGINVGSTYNNEDVGEDSSSCSSFAINGGIGCSLSYMEECYEIYEGWEEDAWCANPFYVIYRCKTPTTTADSYAPYTEEGPDADGFWNGWYTARFCACK